jgi:hypothetical protein
MWKARIFYGVLYTIVGLVNAQFHTLLNVIAAIFMFVLAAASFNMAQEEYYESKQEDKEDE